jgi:hypothetical protein
MMIVTAYSIVRLLDMLQDAGLLDNLPDVPKDNADFEIGSDTYLIEQCTCGKPICLEWHALSVYKMVSAEDQDPDVIITLAIRAKAQGYERFSDYVKDAIRDSFSLALYYYNTPSSDWDNTSRTFDPFTVVLAMSMVYMYGIDGSDEDPNSTSAWAGNFAAHNYIH